MTGCIHHRWFVVMAAFSVRAIVYGITYTSGIVYVIILKNFQTGKAETSWISSIITTVVFAAGPPASFLISKFGWRVTAFVSGLIAGIGLILSSLSTSLSILILSYGFVTGFGCGMAYMAACVIVPTYFATFSRQKLVVALASCGTGFGTFLFSPIIQIIDAYYGWRGLFIVLAGVALQFCSLGLFFRPVSNTTCTNREKTLPTWNFMKNPGFYVTHTGFLLTAFGDSIIYGHLGEYSQTLGYPSSNGAYLYSIVGFSAFILKILQGIALDTNIYLSFPIKLAIIFYLLGGIATSFLFLTESYGMLVVYAALFGANNAASGGSIVIGILQSYYGDENLELTIGVNLAFLGIGNLFGAPIAGLIFESYVSYTPVLITVVLVKVLASLMFLLALKLFPEIKKTLLIVEENNRSKRNASKEIISGDGPVNVVNNYSVESEKTALLLDTNYSVYSERPRDDIENWIEISSSELRKAEEVINISKVNEIGV